MSEASTNSSAPAGQTFTRFRVGIALLLGALGCLFVWVAAPYNNFLLNNSYISDTYLPVAGVVYMLALLLIANPIVSRLHAQWVINARQFALIFAMLLGAAVLPSQGLLRMLPWSIASSNLRINAEAPLAEAIEEADIPPVLFPDAIGFDVAAPASEQFIDQLDPGASIPWAAWMPVLLSLSVFLLACWLLMIGIGMIMFPHWRDTERLPFPLLSVQRRLFEGVGPGHVIPSLFRDPLFWVGAGVVMLCYASNGLHHHTGGGFPAFPLGWDLRAIFTEVPWRYMSPEIKQVRHIYFVLIGMAFFMPNRVGFSIWFTVIAYGFYVMIGRAYFQPFRTGVVADHRNGAMIAVALGVLYLSRHHWIRVGKLLVRRAADDADRLLQMAGWMLCAGCAGIFFWMLWAGVGVGWSLAFVLIGFMVSLLIARIVAETGLPFVRITGLTPHYFMGMVPASLLSGAAIYMAGFVAMVFSLGSRVSAAVMATHALGMDREASPRQQLRIGFLMIGILLLGLVVCGAVHLTMGYSFTSSLDGIRTPVSNWGASRLEHSQSLLVNWSQGVWHAPGYNRFGHICFGIGLAAALQYACLTLPRWPLHPIGLLLVGHYYGQLAWASVFIGWALKMFILEFAGAAAYRRAGALFLGLILGEIFSAIIWTLVPVILILMGHEARDVGHIPLLPT